ncbi:MAG: hypothetical protein LQ352_008416, partial [Teloschistes flavicans]
ILSGVNAAIASGHINGVIWALRPAARKQIIGSSSSSLAQKTAVPSNLLLPHAAGKKEEKDTTTTTTTTTTVSYEHLLNNKHPRYRFLDFAPQRAILAHRSTALFLTHAGPSSANEALFHGVPMLAMGIYGDQLPNSMRLAAAGVAEALPKDDPCLATTLAEKAARVLEDREGAYARDVLRSRRIAVSASRRKHLAADLVEEVLWDWEGGSRGNEGSSGRRRRPMHLQTADMRMGWWKGNNLDLWVAVGAVCMACVGVGWKMLVLVSKVK